MNTKDLAERNLIYKVRTGSHAYRTALPSSDVDYAGIFIPPIEYYFGLQAFDLLCEQAEEDKSYYSLRKYANLALANNPNVLELLFTDQQSICLSTPASDELRRHRHSFLSQRCQKTFVGYAKAQLHRIRTHTKWLAQELHDLAILEPLYNEGKVTKDWIAWRFGENMLKRLGVQDTSMYSRSGVSNPDSNGVLELFKHSNIILPDKEDDRFLVDSKLSTGLQIKTFQKHLYDEAKKKRDQYVTWMAERNPARHETELKFGYDTKHAMHLIRLLRMGYEVLTLGDLIVARPDAAELLEIRAGQWSYEEVIQYADDMVSKIDSIPEEQMAVPVTPDTNRISKTIIDITQQYLSGYHEDHT
jgi:predicted nucleotidyltransferase